MQRPGVHPGPPPHGSTDVNATANASQAPGQPTRKKGNGCLIALLVAGIVGCLLLCAGGIVVWRALSSETGQAVLGAIGDAKRMAEKAANAPGVKELEALGCMQALVMDLSDVQEITRRFAKDAGEIAIHERVVSCSVRFGQSAPTCEAVAQVYVAALGGNAGVPFSVVVQSQDQREGCTARFDARGAAIVEEAEQPGEAGEAESVEGVAEER